MRMMGALNQSHAARQAIKCKELSDEELELHLMRRATEAMQLLTTAANNLDDKYTERSDKQDDRFNERFKQLTRQSSHSGI